MTRPRMMKQAAVFAAITGSYFLAGTLGLQLAFVNASATAVWPPTGIAIAAVVLFGFRAAVPVFLGAFLVNITTAGTVATVTGIAAGNTLEAVLGGWLVSRFASGAKAFERPRDVMAFAGLAAILSPVVAASIGVTSLCLGGLAAWSDAGPIWLTWWLGDAVGALSFAPAAILWGSERPRLFPDARRAMEAVLAIAALVASGGVAFLGWLPRGSENLPLQFICLPPLVWAAFRFRQHLVALLTLGLSAMALLGTLHGFGVFARENAHDALLLLQAYMGVLCVMGLCVASAIAQRERAEAGLRASEERLRLAGKMEALGRLAGGVAHDFNNILTVIRGHADLLAAATPAGRRVDPSIDAIADASDHAARLTQRLLAISRRQMLSPRTHELNAIVAEMGSLLRRLIGERITVSVELGPGSHPVRVDRTQIEQVIMNLALNARDAMPEGGVLALATGLVEGRDHPAAGPHVVLRVSDTGSGMDEETRRHLFEPFFTTKQRGMGTGLGLASVYGIVQQSGGHLVVTTGPGRGTIFEIFLPVSPEPVVLLTPPPSRPATPGPMADGTRTILLAEDEPAVRSMLRAVLERQGYRVLVAANGAEALAICESEPGVIDLLLTDLVMPLLNGKELAEKAALVRPAMKRVFISGHAADMLSDGMTLGIDGAVLAKPIAPSVLASILREVLEDPR